jgi:hypothetical protein
MHGFKIYLQRDRKKTVWRAMLFLFPGLLARPLYMLFLMRSVTGSI